MKFKERHFTAFSCCPFTNTMRLYFSYTVSKPYISQTNALKFFHAQGQATYPDILKVASEWHWLRKGLYFSFLCISFSQNLQLEVCSLFTVESKVLEVTSIILSQEVKPLGQEISDKAVLPWRFFDKQIQNSITVSCLQTFKVIAIGSYQMMVKILHREK